MNCLAMGTDPVMSTNTRMAMQEKSVDSIYQSLRAINMAPHPFHWVMDRAMAKAMLESLGAGELLLLLDSPNKARYKPFMATKAASTVRPVRNSRSKGLTVLSSWES